MKKAAIAMILLLMLLVACKAAQVEEAQTEKIASNDPIESGNADLEEVDSIDSDLNADSFDDTFSDIENI